MCWSHIHNLVIEAFQTSLKNINQLVRSISHLFHPGTKRHNEYREKIGKASIAPNFTRWTGFLDAVAHRNQYFSKYYDLLINKK